MIIRLPWPPSANTYWRHLSKGPMAGRTLISEEGRSYRKAVTQLAAAEGWESFAAGDRLAVHIQAWMPDRRRRDVDNIFKSCLDSLTHAGVWSDDSQIDDLRIVRVPTLGGMLKVHIERISSATVQMGAAA